MVDLHGQPPYPSAIAGTLIQRHTMALTTLDLLAEPARVKAAKDEFAKSK